jgi:hypothetical protein
MNVTALKSMIKHWKPMMVLLHRLRDRYLVRFPEAASGLGVGHIERFCNLVLAVPTYLLVRQPPAVASGCLHPLLSSLFRVTDGLRMTTNFMQVKLTDRAPLHPEAPVTCAEIHDYVERTGAFLSVHGVCAGPRPMVEEFLQVVVEGKVVAGAESVVLEGQALEALHGLDAAFDYGLHGLRAYAVALSLWPAVSRAYQRLGAIVAELPRRGIAAALADRLKERVTFLEIATTMGTEAERQVHERWCAHGYQQARRALFPQRPPATLAESIAPAPVEAARGPAEELYTLLRQRLGSDPAARSMAEVLVEHLCAEQGIVRAAEGIQREICNLLGRPLPRRPLLGADIASHRQLHRAETRFPYLLDDLDEIVGIRLMAGAEKIEVIDRWRWRWMR